MNIRTSKEQIKVCRLCKEPYIVTFLSPSSEQGVCNKCYQKAKRNSSDSWRPRGTLVILACLLASTARAGGMI